MTFSTELKKSLEVSSIIETGCVTFFGCEYDNHGTTMDYLIITENL